MSAGDFGFLDQLNDAAQAVTLSLFRTDLSIDSKRHEPGDYDPVTKADREAELALRRLISDRFPQDGIAGEEFPDHQMDASRVWHLDPIDGTRQFISGMPLWGTMIGLTIDGQASIGSIAHPFTDERFYGAPGMARYRRGAVVQRLQTRACSTLSAATLFSTSPKLFRGDKSKRFTQLSETVRLTRYGIDCYAFCLVALGFVDLVVESGLDDHDIIPAVPIIEAAGGAVVDWQGRRARAGGDVLAVGDRRLIEPTLKILNG